LLSNSNLRGLQSAAFIDAQGFLMATTEDTRMHFLFLANEILMQTQSGCRRIAVSQRGYQDTDLRWL